MYLFKCWVVKGIKYIYFIHTGPRQFSKIMRNYPFWEIASKNPRDFFLKMYKTGRGFPELEITME